MFYTVYMKRHCYWLFKLDGVAGLGWGSGMVGRKGKGPALRLLKKNSQLISDPTVQIFK